MAAEAEVPSRPAPWLPTGSNGRGEPTSLPVPEALRAVPGSEESVTWASDTDCTGRGSGRSRHTPTAATNAATAATTVSSSAPRLPGSIRLSRSGSGTQRCASLPQGSCRVRRTRLARCLAGGGSGDRSTSLSSSPSSSSPSPPSSWSSSPSSPSPPPSSSSSSPGTQPPGSAGVAFGRPGAAGAACSPASRRRESGRFRTARTLRTGASLRTHTGLIGDEQPVCGQPSIGVHTACRCSTHARTRSVCQRTYHLGPRPLLPTTGLAASSPTGATRSVWSRSATAQRHQKKIQRRPLQAPASSSSPPGRITPPSPAL